MLENRFRPLGDRVFVKRIEKEQTTASGIFIPDSAKEKPQMGSVLAVGPGKRDAQGNAIPMQVKVGDTIFIGKYSGTEVQEDHVIVREDEILGVVEQ